MGKPYNKRKTQGSYENWIRIEYEGLKLENVTAYVQLLKTEIIKLQEDKKALADLLAKANVELEQAKTELDSQKV